jgi:ribulose-phosphate 3-epimerase
MTELILSASILSADFACLGDQLGSIEAAGVDWIHVDVMDGQFVPNITMGPFIVEHCTRLSTLPSDVHLMIEHPERHIEAFQRAGARNISIHIEDNPNVYRTLQQIRSLGCKPGIVLNPGTPASSVFPVLPLVDLVLVMTVNPGFSGQSFLPEVLPKIQELQLFITRQHLPTRIQVDGGITDLTIPAVCQAGASIIVAATAIFKHPQGIQAGVMALRQAVA